MNYIIIYNKLINDKIDIIISNSNTKKVKSKKKCILCNNYNNDGYKYNYNTIVIDDIDIHMLTNHNMIKFSLYEKICNINISNYDIQFLNINTNAFNMIDGLYHRGSKKIYIDNNKNIFNSNINRYSEHHGYILFTNNKVDKIVVLNQFRVASNDPYIYLPKHNIEMLNQKYIFHTHPTTPYIGSRFKNGIIYEFPSIGDINHFIEHHNRGELQLSLVITPEGLYVIRKNNFNKNKIIIDNEIFISELDKTLKQCLNESINKYKHSIIYDIDNYKINNNYFYKYVASNLNYIIIINKVLEKYDIAIDFYSRNKKINDTEDIFGKDDKDDKISYIFTDIFLPFI